MSSFIETHPHLKQELHPERNSAINLQEVSSRSKIKLWWKDSLNHEWEAAVGNRTNKKPAGCPFCAGKKILEGFNDFKSQEPELLKEWNYDKNTVLPESLSSKSTQKVWWLGECGHEWEATINSRAVRKSICPFCSGRKVLKGFNDIATTHPSITNEWHPTKNGILDPKDFSAGSNKKVWWKGPCNHEWDATIDKRMLLNRGCPICSGNKVLTGFNDLATTHPLIASEVSATLNHNGVSENSIIAGSKIKIWWQCSNGHHWNISPEVRTNYLTGCPVCSNRKIIKGVNDLEHLLPDLVKEWHPIKNGTLLPSEISLGSNQKVWWQCSANHEWETTPYNRTSVGYNCPQCSHIVSKAENQISDFIRSKGLEVKQSNRTVLGGKELDIYIPERNVAIEFNGLYWHSELYKHKNYHYDKWKECKQKGIKLFQIWEDEWLSNPNLVLGIIEHKLNLRVQQKDKIYARKTKISEVTTKEAKLFFNKNHIQGYASASYYYGLEFEGTIYAAIALKKESEGMLNIIRYATSENIPGGFSKLLKYAENTLNPTGFITFSDNCISDGALYANNGFILDVEIEPDYKYIWRGQRKHKFGYRIEKFKKDPSLLWADGLTEKELASLNKIYRIWDAGKTRWIKKVKN